ncbi:MAG: phosphatidate cytidylyltransferase [Burkholderiaceae bacterium]|jgi:phosphatidate cytidylyltransferase|nr:phosphatidate cytidylyltransferase [Burkholderiaceae bacterium]
MLKTRVLTALGLAIVLLAVLLSRSFAAFVILTTIFFAGASWEAFRLFESARPVPYAAVCTLLFAIIACVAGDTLCIALAAFSVAAWFFCLAPSLALPFFARSSLKNHLFEGLYFISLSGSFFAFLYLYRHSLILLLSAVILVNIADIGAYFAGRTLGRHKLAPSISPGKTWEGAAGGLLAVILVAVATVFISGLENVVTVRVYRFFGWFGMLLAALLLVGMSILGDLLESRLKRRCGFKDSSGLLPGHGGVLDRIDSLIPVLPLTVLIHMWT